MPYGIYTRIAAWQSTGATKQFTPVTFAGNISILSRLERIGGDFCNGFLLVSSCCPRTLKLSRY
jgi:hypothetical protein